MARFLQIRNAWHSVMVLAAATVLFAGAGAAQAAVPWAPPQPSSLNDVLSLLQQSLATVGDEINAGGPSTKDQASHLENSAAAGDADAQFRLAVHYRLGLGVDRDPTLAIAWYRKASEKRLVAAELHLGAMLINGEGGAIAPAEALSWWLVAARGGNPLAIAGARLLGAQLSFPEQTDARKLAEHMIGVWTSFEQWAAANSGGALDNDLVAAANAGDMATIKRLIDSGASPDAINQHGRPALLAAAISGHDSIADALLRRGANANAIDGNGKALLMGAADAGSEAVTKLLLRHGATVNAVDRHGRTALSTAAWRGHGGVVDALLAVGADPNLRPNDGASALMGAAVNGYAAIAGRLLTNGAAIDHADKDDFTALIRAAWNGHSKTVAVLIANRARIDAESKDGKTALRLAHSNGYPDIVKMLREAGARR
jgi:ankyrin repeat protein